MDIATAITTVTALGELTKAIVSGKIDDEVKAKATELNNSIITLQGAIFSVQSQNHELLDAKRRIEEELSKSNNWNRTANKYILNEVCTGVFLYSLKENPDNPEPFHHICPNCYASQKVSILTKNEISFAGEEYVCKSPECKAKYLDYSNQKPYEHIDRDPAYS